MIRLSILASSSSGNSSLVDTDRTRLLVDAGIGKRDTFAHLAELGVAPDSLTAILITHEHGDHTSGMCAIARKLDIPIYLSRKTAAAIQWGNYSPLLEEFDSGARLSIGDIEIQSFSIPHDAADPVGYSFYSKGVKITIATDLGHIPDTVRAHLRGSDVLLLESNHDVEMLKVGPYPRSVKQRVMSSVGHLSNESACQFIQSDLDTQTDKLILGHLSEGNNRPEIVRLMAEQALGSKKIGLSLAAPLLSFTF